MRTSSDAFSMLPSIKNRFRTFVLMKVELSVTLVIFWSVLETFGADRNFNVPKADGFTVLPGLGQLHLLVTYLAVV